MQHDADEQNARERSKPAFTKEVLDEITEICGRYPNNEAALIPVLFIAQREFSVLQPNILDLVADTLGLPAAKVNATATFYTMFHKEPVGKFHLQLCKNISCYLRGSDDIMDAIEDELGIEKGSTTEDGLFTVSEVECLAACGRAPVIQINTKYHEWITPDSMRQLIRELRAQHEGKDLAPTPPAPPAPPAPPVPPTTPQGN